MENKYEFWPDTIVILFEQMPYQQPIPRKFDLETVYQMFKQRMAEEAAQER